MADKGKKLKKSGKASNEEIVKELDEAQEKEFLKSIKSRRKDFLVKLTLIEKDRIAKYICDRHDEAKGKHKKLWNRLDEYDSVYRMERTKTAGDDGSSPNYRTPLSTE